MFPAASKGRTSIYMPMRCRSRTLNRFSDFSACEQFSNKLHAFVTCPSCEFSCPNLNRFCLPFCACGLLLSSRSAMIMLCCLRLTMALRYLFSQLKLLHRLGVRAHHGTRRPLPMLFQIDIMRLLQPGSQEKLGRPMWTPQELQNLVEYDK